MLKEIVLPEIAENVESGTVVEILVAEGDTIEAEQPIVELETDKATFEVPSTESGIIKEIKVSEGDEVKVGEIIVTVETEAENEDDSNQEKEKSEADLKEEKPKKATQGIVKDQDVSKPKEDQKEDQPIKEKDKKTEVRPADIPAAPSVRMLARKLDVDLTKVSGSGPGGRIIKEDIENFKTDGKKSQQRVSEKLPDFSKWGTIEKKPLSKIRQVTAESMLKSWQTIPQVTQFDQAELTTVEDFIDKYSIKAEKEGTKLTITAILLKLCATALQIFPKFNASLDMDHKELIYKKYVNIGVAVDTPQGLLVPVIRNVESKSVFKLALEVSELAKKSREKNISPDELQGGNFTISNLGGIGGTNFTPIVYPPQVAILGVARSNKLPVFLNGNDQFEVKNVLPLSLSYDHRAIDGAEGARFLRWICNSLENPFLALMEGGN